MDDAWHGPLGHDDRPPSAWAAAGVDLEVVADVLGDGLVILDADGRIEVVNATFAAMVGLPVEEIRGLEPPFPWWPERFRSVNAMHFQTALSGATIGLFTSEFQDQAGAQRPIESKWSRVVTADGRRLNVVSVRDVSRRVRAEAAVEHLADEVLRERELSWNAFQSVSDGLVVVGPDRTIQLVNDRMCDLIGVDRDNLLGTGPPFPWWPAGEHAARAASLEAALHAEGLQSGEIELAGASGRLIPVEVTWTSMPASGVAGERLMLATVRDLTFRREAERLLRRGRDHLRALVEGMPEGVILRRTNPPVVEFVNSAACRILGLTEEEIRRRSPRDPRWCLVREDGTRLGFQEGAQFWGGESPELEALLTGNPVRDLVLGVDTGAGTQPGWIKLNAEPLGDLDASGRSEMILVTISDVTRLKAAEREAQRQQDFCGAVVQGVNEGLFVVGDDARLLAVNPGMERLTGFKAADLIGTGPPFPWWAPEEAERMPELLEALMSGTLREAEAVIRTASGERRAVAARGTTSPRRDGEETLHVVTVRDVTERRAAERRLAESEQRLALVVEQTTDGLAILDQDARIVTRNPALERITGVRAEDAVGYTVEELPVDVITPDGEALSAGQRPARRALAGDLAGAITLGIRRHGTDRITWVVQTTHPVASTEGVGASWALATVTDVTELHTAQQALTDSEDRLQRVFEQVTDGLLLIDVPGERVTHCNTAATTLLGVSERELLSARKGELRFDLREEDGRRLDLDEHPVRAFLATRVMQRRRRVLARNGEVDRLLRITVQGFPPAGGARRPDQVLLTITDLTDLYTAQQALRDSEERYRALFGYQPDAVFRLTPEGQVIGASPSVWRVLRLDPNDPPQHLGEHIHPDHQAAWWDAMHRTAAGENDVRLEVRKRRGDGAWIWVEITGAPVFNDDGTIVEVQHSLRDVTDRVMREQLQGALHRIAELIAADAPKRTVFARIASELAATEDVQVAAVIRFQGSDGIVEGYWAAGDPPDTQPKQVPMDLTLQDTATGLVWGTGKPAILDIRPAAGGVSGQGWYPQLCQGMAVPIRVDGIEWGALALGRTSGPFEAGALERLLRFGDIAALGVAAINRREQLEHDAGTDPLTGLDNRRVFEERLIEEVERARRYDRRLSVVMLDLDHFKQINDTHGHVAGDHVLQTVAKHLIQAARTHDVIARLGGEEFGWILPETDGDAAADAAERLRVAIHQARTPGAGPVTASLGVAELADTEGSGDIWEHADQALYAAKGAGRNRVWRLKGP